jgi:hypothetical protein
MRRLDRAVGAAPEWSICAADRRAGEGLRVGASWLCELLARYHRENPFGLVSGSWRPRHPLARIARCGEEIGARRMSLLPGSAIRTGVMAVAG